jgi:hypothetical protein
LRKSALSAESVLERVARMVIEKTGRDEVLGRDLFVLHVQTVPHLPSDISLGSRFTCLVAWDARDAPDDEVALVAKKLIDARSVYVCAWGPDCERVHDIVDRVSAAVTAAEGRDAFLMTTWHAGEPLSAAIWFALTCTHPEEAHEGSCHATLAICIGNDEWAAQIRDAFRDPAKFLRRAAEQEE